MEKQNLNIDFNLKAIKVEQFAILEENYEARNELPNLMTSFQNTVDREKKMIGCFTDFVFNQGDKTFLKLVLSCHFLIEQESWNHLIEDDKIIVPKGFLAHLTMIAIGTARGVLFAKTEGTQFSIFQIPLINVAEMYKEDFIVELEKSPNA